MKATRFVQTAFLLLALAATGAAQQSDYEIKERFKSMYDELRGDIDSARTPAQMEQISSRISALQSEFGDQRKLISGAFYPKTFDDMMRELREYHVMSQEKASTIHVQGSRIVELEGLLTTLTTELEALKTEREQLLTQLRTSQNSLAQQRELVRRLNDNLAANDRLIGAMVDSIFLPFGKNIDALSEVQKDALGQKLEKANILTRIEGIAQDNIAFLSTTRLEAKDYGVLVGQFEQFRNRWDGLKDKVTAAIAATNAAKVSKGKGKKGSEPVAEPDPAARVDAAIAEWHARLDASFWSSLANEFSARGVSMQQFSDAKTFSASIRAYVESAKANGDDTKVFVDEIWIPRIDKDWRAALESESMLGKTEYASLDRTVSQLRKEKFNWQIVFWVFNIIAVVVVGWWFLTRKPKGARTQTQQPATAKPNA